MATASADKAVWWQEFLKTPHLGEYLALIGLVMTLIGFAFTIATTLRAKNAAESAKAAAEQAKGEVRKLDLIAEVATVLQLVEELKRLHRSKAADVLPDRYSGLRIKMMVIRESALLGSDGEQQLLQDVIVRLSALEKALDKNPTVLEDKKQVARSNESLNHCTEAIVRLIERVKSRVVTI